MNVDFARMFSVGGFEALRVLRKHEPLHPGLPREALVVVIKRVEADATGLDFDAALNLAEIVAADAKPDDGIQFYQRCVEDSILALRPTWARIMTYGRRKFVEKLTTDEAQCFRQAGLLETPPSWDTIAWWDRITAQVRLITDQAKMSRARQAEGFSLAHEAARLRDLGISLNPQWTAVEDNQAGYDIHSYDPGSVEPTARLIEVKSTIASPLRFFLTRHEWEQALRFGAAYHFHVWDLSATPPRLHQRTAAEIARHVPTDNEKGRWSNAEIPVGT